MLAMIVTTLAALILVPFLAASRNRGTEGPAGVHDIQDVQDAMDHQAERYARLRRML